MCDDEDREGYLHCLVDALARFDCRLHAYVPMDSHVQKGVSDNFRRFILKR